MKFHHIFFVACMVAEVLISPRIILVNLLGTSIPFGGQDSALLWSSSSHVSYALSSDYPSFFSFCWELLHMRFYVVLNGGVFMVQINHWRTCSKWSMWFPPFLGCSVWYFQAQTINTFSTLGCLHAVIQSLKMFEPAFNHVTSADGCRCHWQEKLVNLRVCSCELACLLLWMFCGDQIVTWKALPRAQSWTLDDVGEIINVLEPHNTAM